jgi:hypothetical protein
MAIAIRQSPPRVHGAVHAVTDRVFGGAVFLYFLGVILPTELAVNLFGMALFPVRIVLLLFFIPAVLQLTKPGISVSSHSTTSCCWPWCGC